MLRQHVGRRRRMHGRCRQRRVHAQRCNEDPRLCPSSNHAAFGCRAKRAGSHIARARCAEAHSGRTEPSSSSIHIVNRRSRMRVQRMIDTLRSNGSVQRAPSCLYGTATMRLQLTGTHSPSLVASNFFLCTARHSHVAPPEYHVHGDRQIVMVWCGPAQQQTPNCVP
jgi:hypothetical protein